MSVLHPSPREHSHRTRRHDGNGVDLHYLEEARTALAPAIRISRAVSVRTTDRVVRTLASSALSEQTRQLAAISTCLLAWDRPEADDPLRADHTLPELHGPALDLAFTDQLTAHALASIRAARTEMVAGASHPARAIAQDAISAQHRLLAQLDRLRQRRRRE